MYKIAITDFIEPPAAIESSFFPQSEILFLEANHLIPTDTASIEALLVWHREIDEDYLLHFPKLKIVVRYGVGFDNIDLDAIKNKGLIFSNTPDYGVEEVADTACAMILNATRSIFRYDFVTKNSINRWQDPFLSHINRSSSINVGGIGVGRIGTAVIQRLKNFNFNLYGFDPYVSSGHEKAIGYKRCNALEELINIANVISFHCPCNKETLGMLDENFISALNDNTMIINTARGKILKNLDVLEVGLRNGKIAVACLDVLPDEPIDRTHSLLKDWINQASWLGGRLIINPHSAFYSQEAWSEMRYKSAETAYLYLTKGLIRNRII